MNFINHNFDDETKQWVRNLLKPNRVTKAEQINLPFYKFKTQNLFIKSIQHPTWENENGEDNVSEGLSTLGDSVISTVVLTILIKKGVITKKDLTLEKIKYTRAEFLSTLSERIGVSKIMRVGVGEMKNKKGLIKRQQLIMESYIAAVYLDSDQNLKLITDLIEPLLFIEGCEPKTQGFKNKLQERVQSKTRDETVPITYESLRVGGTDHEPVIESVVKYKNEIIGKATSSSSKEAEDMAAEFALLKIEEGKEL